MRPASTPRSAALRPPAEAVAVGVHHQRRRQQLKSRRTFRAEDRAQSPEVTKQGAEIPKRPPPCGLFGPAEGECTQSKAARTTTSSTKQINRPRDDDGGSRNLT